MKHKFVEFIPKTLENNTIYISIEYGAVTHMCCCGCGEKVFTPLSPTDWKLIYDGTTISLHPSIGNWNLPCRSHYWIENSKVKWSNSWSNNQITKARKQDIAEKEKYYEQLNSKKKSLWTYIKKWFSLRHKE